MQDVTGTCPGAFLQPRQEPPQGLSPPRQVPPLLPQFPKFPCHSSSLGHSRSPLPGPHPSPSPAAAPSGLTSVGHDGHLGPYVVQLLQPPPEGREPEVVEAGGEDAQLHVLVRPQEAGHHLGTDGAGAPGQEPGDAVVLVRGQLRSMEPRQEAEFCVVGLILIELGEMEKERARSGLAEQACGRAGGRGDQRPGSNSIRGMGLADLLLL